MKRNSQPRVLMLGWEYPPRFAGGLGKACRGLSLAMARQGAQIFFILPTFPNRISENHLEVLGARESLIASGWTEEYLDQLGQPISRNAGGISVARADAKLFPYGVNPNGPMPAGIRRMFTSGKGAGKATDAGSLQVEGEPLSDSSDESDFEQPLGSKPTPKEYRSEIETPSRSNKEIYGKNLWSEVERYVFAVRKLSDSHEVDVVHAHDWMTFPAAFEFQRVTGVPVFLHVHATEYDRSGESVDNGVFRIEREGFRRANHIFAVSRYTAGIIERLYGISRKKISVAYNAPDEEAKHLSSKPDAERDPNVIFLGRLTYQKGPDHFLKAAQLVAQAHKTARFIFCGTGDMFDKLRTLAHQLGIEERVHFAGFVDPAGVDQILSTSKVLVMPSVSEPFGLVALEAIHCGIPVILSKQSGVREVLPRALQVDFWDHEKLADQILGALRLPALSKQLVDEGMEQVQRLSWDHSAAHIINTYKHHLGSTLAQAVGGAHGR